MTDDGSNRVRALIADEDVQIIGEAASATEARRQISEHQPDLVFMDVEMPGGTGIELLRDIGESDPYVILVTAHPEFALPAFEVQAADYLVAGAVNGNGVARGSRWKKSRGSRAQASTAACTRRTASTCFRARFPRSRANWIHAGSFASIARRS